MAASSLLTYTVNRSSFSVPSDLKVLSAEGYGAFGDSVRTVRKVTFTKPNPASSSPQSPQSKKSQPGANANNTTTAATGGGGTVVEEERYFIIRKFSGIVKASSPHDLKRLVRLCQLHLAVGSIPGLLPLADAYRDEQHPGDVYCMYPALPSTLAEVVYSRTPLMLDQGAAIIRELCRFVEKLHSCGLVLGDLRPDWVRIDPELRTQGAVSVANTTYIHFPAEGVDAVFGGLDSAPGNKPLLWYRAPELVLDGVTQLTPAADMWTLGCITAELFLRRPLFEASTTAEYLNAVTNIMGIPQDAQTYYNPRALALLAQVPHKKPLAIANALPGVPLEVCVLVQRLLNWNPSNRMSAKDLLRMPFLNPLPPGGSVPSGPGTGAAGGAGTSGTRTTTTTTTAQPQGQQAATPANQQAADAPNTKAPSAATTQQQQQQQAMDDLKTKWTAVNTATVQDVTSLLVTQLDECVSFY